MQEENFTEKDSLTLINEMIGKAKKSHIEKGIASIVWGSIIVICSLVSWYGAHNHVELGDIWLLTIVALIIQIIFGVKEGNKRNHISYEQVTMKYVWMAFGISVFFASFYSGKYPSNGETSSIFMMLYAIPTFITGGVTKFKPMIYGGILCWILSFVSLYTSFEIDNLLMAACGLFAWLIPGIILWKRYKKNLAANV
jgi:hypothetical protein